MVFVNEHIHSRISQLLGVDQSFLDRLGEFDRREILGFDGIVDPYDLDHAGIAHPEFPSEFGRVHNRDLQNIVRPVVAGSGGRVIKTDADNVFATFDDAPAALAAARAIQRSLDAANAFLPEDWDLHASIGIGYGPLLVVDEEDLFGSEMNVASKLGEDIAGRGEILLSVAARERLGAEARAGLEPLTIELSGLSLEAFKLSPER